MTTKRGQVIAGLTLLCASAFAGGHAMAAGKGKATRAHAAKPAAAAPAPKAEPEKAAPAPDPSAEKMKAMQEHPNARRGRGHF